MLQNIWKSILVPPQSDIFPKDTGDRRLEGMVSTGLDTGV